MGLETFGYIDSLNALNPTGTDGKNRGDDHIRGVKSTLLASFPAVAGPVTASHTELSYVTGVTSAIQTQLNAKGAIAGQTWSGAHDYTGGTIVVPTRTLGDNTTNAASTAFVFAGLALKANLAGATYTGTHNFSGATAVTAPTPAALDDSTNVATTEWVNNVATNAALPGQTGNAGKFLQTDGTNASWNYTIASQAEAEAGSSSSTLMTPQRTNQAIAALAPGWEDIGTASPTGADTSVSFTGISTAYKDLAIVFENVTTGGGSPAIRLEVGDNTPTYASPVTVTDSASVFAGVVSIPDCKADWGYIVPSVLPTTLTSPVVSAGTPLGTPIMVRRITGGVRSIRLSVVSSTFGGAGTFRLRGRK